MLLRHSALANNLEHHEKVHILVKMVGVFSHTGRCIQDNGRNCLTVAQLYSQEFWMQSSSNFSPRNNCYETDEKKVVVTLNVPVLLFLYKTTAS